MRYTGTMIAMLALALAAQSNTTDPAGSDSPEIVVTAKRRDCHMLLKGVDLSGNALDRYAHIWADGRPVRVVMGSDATYKCMAKVMFKLADHGVRGAYFVDPASGR